MAGLLSAAKITALKAIQVTLTAEAEKVQTELNALWDADLEHPATKHSAWRPFWEMHKAMKDAIVAAEKVATSNEDAYGEWKY